MVLMHHTHTHTHVVFFSSSYDVQMLLLFYTPGGSTILQFGCYYYYYYLEHLSMVLSFMKMHLKQDTLLILFACAHFLFHIFPLCLLLCLIDYLFLSRNQWIQLMRFLYFWNYFRSKKIIITHRMESVISMSLAIFG